MIKLRDTQGGVDYYPGSVESAEQLVEFRQLRHFEIWAFGELIKFGSTPTRIRKTQVADGPK